jgi:hypothetical protein
MKKGAFPNYSCLSNDDNGKHQYLNFSPIVATDGELSIILSSFLKASDLPYYIFILDPCLRLTLSRTAHPPHLLPPKFVPESKSSLFIRVPRGPKTLLFPPAPSGSFLAGCSALKTIKD